MDRLEAFLVRHAADPAAAAASLAARKAEHGRELGVLGAPFVPPAPRVGLSWSGLPVDLNGSAAAASSAAALSPLTPRLNFLGACGPFTVGSVGPVGDVLPAERGPCGTHPTPVAERAPCGWG